MSVLTDKLLFVIQRRAISYIKSKTALSTYSIRQFKLGHIPKVSLDRFSINAMYRREVYKYVRQEGLSTANASRIRDWSYGRMSEYMDVYRTRMREFASNVLRNRILRDRADSIFIDYDVYYDDNIEWIKDAFRKSKKSLEEIEDNPYVSP